MECRNKKCRAQLIEGAAFCHVCGRKQTPDARRRGKRPNGTGTVYALQGKRSRPWVAARSGVILGYYATKAEAMTALERHAPRQITDKFNMTFAEVYEAWREEHFRTITDKGAEGYKNAFKWFESLHGLKFRNLRTADFQSVIDSAVQAGRSAETANKLRQLAGQLCKWAMREELITTNWAQHLVMPTKDKKEKAIFTAEEIKRIEDNGSDTAKIVLMMIYTGVRVGEMFTIRTADYHGTYCIGGSKTDAGRDRIIPIPEKVRPLFEYFASSADPDGVLLSGYSGNKVVGNWRNREWAELMKELNISGKTPHSTRHTFASMAAAAGVTPEALQKILGHANYTTTAEIYIHQDIASLCSEVSKILP